MKKTPIVTKEKDILLETKNTKEKNKRIIKNIVNTIIYLLENYSY